MDPAKCVPPPPPTTPCRDQSSWCLSFSFTNTWTKHSEIYFLIKISLREMGGRGMDWEYGVGCCCWSYCSVAELCLTLWDPINCSIPGFPVLHYLLGVCSNSCPLSQWCQPSWPSPPLSPPSPPAFSLSQHQGLFQWVGSLHQVARILELQLQHQSFQWIFSIDFLPLGLVDESYYI